MSTQRYRRTGRPRSFQHRLHGLAYGYYECLVIVSILLFVSTGDCQKLQVLRNQ
jgi:hypothetical protein